MSDEATHTEDSDDLEDKHARLTRRLVKLDGASRGRVNFVLQADMLLQQGHFKRCAPMRSNVRSS